MLGMRRPVLNTDRGLLAPAGQSPDRAGDVVTAPLLDVDAVMTRLGCDRAEARRVMREAGAFRVSRLVVREDQLSPDRERVARAVLDAVPVVGWVTQAELAARVGVSKAQVSAVLAARSASVVRRGRGFKGRPYRYRRSTGASVAA